MYSACGKRPQSSTVHHNTSIGAGRQMTWAEFKQLTREEQQIFIDELSKDTPVTSGVLARRLGVSRSTAYHYAKERGLLLSHNLQHPIVISESLRREADKIIRSELKPDGTMVPSTDLKKLFISCDDTLYDDEEEEKRTFSYAVREEQKSGHDLCQFTTQNLDNVFVNYLGVAPTRSKHTIYVFKRYSEFCSMLGIPTSDDMPAYELDMRVKIRSKMVASPLHLQKRLDEVFNPQDSDSIDVLYRCVLWLAFAGVPQEDIATIRVSDVDFNRLQVVVRGIPYPLYIEGIGAFRSACSRQTLTLASDGSENTLVTRVPGDLLLRGVYSQIISPTFLMRYLNAKAKKKGTSFGYVLIKKSGQFYRMYELERAGYEPDFTGLVTEIAEHNYAKGKAAKIPSTYPYRRDYAIWKEAFK